MHSLTWKIWCLSPFVTCNLHSRPSIVWIASVHEVKKKFLGQINITPNQHSDTALCYLQILLPHQCKHAMMQRPTASKIHGIPFIYVLITFLIFHSTTDIQPTSFHIISWFKSSREEAPVYRALSSLPSLLSLPQRAIRTPLEAWL